MNIGRWDLFLVKLVHLHLFWPWKFSSPCGQLQSEFTKDTVCEIGTNSVEEIFFFNPFLLLEDVTVQHTLPCNQSCIPYRSVRVSVMLSGQWLTLKHWTTGMCSLLFYWRLPFCPTPSISVSPFRLWSAVAQEKASTSPCARLSVYLLVEELVWLYVYLMLRID